MGLLLEGRLSFSVNGQRLMLEYRYVSCIFADPYDGPTKSSSVLHCVRELLAMGCYEVSLGDTLGVGTPCKTHDLVTYLLDNNVPVSHLAGHFHDTYGQGAANVWQAYQCGMRVFDSSVGGLGGCPFAPGAKGNVATEDLVYMFQNAGVDTGLDLSGLIETGTWISTQLGRKSASRVQKEASATERLSSTLRHVSRGPGLVKESDVMLAYRELAET